jgi:hypothetical protein
MDKLEGRVHAFKGRFSAPITPELHIKRKRA